MTSTAIGLTPIKYDFDIEDTVTFQRPVGEDTQPIPLDDPPAVPRRPRLDTTAEQPAVKATTIGVADEPASRRRVITAEERQAVLNALAAVRMPTAYVPVVAKRPTLWQRLTYTGHRRAQGRIARWLNGGAL